MHDSRFLLARSAHVGLGALFASLLAACGGEGDSTGCSQSSSTAVTAVVEVPEQDVIAAGRVGEGPIVLEECALMCEQVAVDQVLGCDDIGAADPMGGGGSGTGGAGGAGNGGAEASAGGTRLVECRGERIKSCDGRRHAAVDADRSGRGPTEVAAWLSRAAECEAASVPAFLALADELRRLGAPPDLVDDAEHAAADEVRHASVVRGLARHRGAPGHAGELRVTPFDRSLFELALENAVEGCVNETFSGLVAMYQARHARDDRVRRAMGAIADDEVRHGELAWRNHHWACSRLDDHHVSLIEAAMRDAARGLIASLPYGELGPATREHLGLPSHRTATELARGVQSHLWS